MVCRKCGNQLPDHSKFCDVCGNRIMIQKQPAAVTTGQKIQHKKKESKLWIAGAIAGGAAIGLVIAALFANFFIKPWVNGDFDESNNTSKKTAINVPVETKEATSEMSTETKLCLLEFLADYPTVDTIGELVNVLGQPDEIGPYREATSAYCYDNIGFGSLVSYYDYDASVNPQVYNMPDERIWAMEVYPGGYFTEDVWVGMTFEELSQYFYFDLKHPEADESSGGYAADANIQFKGRTYSFTFKFDDYRPEAKSTNAIYWIH